jgi:hypothetical protein
MSQSMSQSRAEQDRLMEEQSLGSGDYEDNLFMMHDNDDYENDYEDDQKEPEA